MSTLSAYGISFAVPNGWDARIYRRPAAPGESTHPILHAGNFPLPAVRGDYGAGAVELMGAANVFLALLEFHPDASSAPLFAGSRPDQLDPAGFSPSSLQRALPGQAGTQAFFSDDGRAFCLFVVIGSWTARAGLVAAATDALGRISIQPDPWGVAAIGMAGT
ncbi:MAG TPA: hypothetical protein VGR90_04945 [Acidimicrobiales bacterium]|nr:hypothetical protein [Acidimicrobiales bacterium]